MPGAVAVPLSMLVVFASAKLMAEIFERLGSPESWGKFWPGC
jgi:hypothetical protein